MNCRAWIAPRTRQVSVAQVRRYMAAHGWHLASFSRPEVLVFEHLRDAEEGVIKMIFPASEQMDDYHMRVFHLISSLGIYEDRYAVEILNEMLYPGDTNDTPAQPVTSQVSPVRK